MVLKHKSSKNFEDVDILIIGAGVAGATMFFKVNPKYKTLLVDIKTSKQLSPYRSTGLLTISTFKKLKKIFKEFKFSRFIKNSYYKFALLDTNNQWKIYTIFKNKPWMYLLDTDNFVRFLLKSASKHANKTAILGKPAKVFSNNEKGRIIIQVGKKLFMPKLLVVATGANKAFVQELRRLDIKLSVNHRFFWGTEYVFRKSRTLAKSYKEDTLYFFGDNVFAGYGGWVAPTTDSIKIGSAGINSPDTILKTLDLYKEKFLNRMNFSEKKQLTHQFSNNIVANGPLKQSFNLVANIALIGEAGGYCGPLAADGIMYAVETANALAKSVNKHGVKNALIKYKPLSFSTILRLKLELIASFVITKLNKLGVNVFKLFIPLYILFLKAWLFLKKT